MADATDLASAATTPAATSGIATTHGVTATHGGIWAGSIKPFIVAHPLGIALVGGAILGLGVYYLTKKSTPEEAVS
jgi:hypothetical protein